MEAEEVDEVEVAEDERGDEKEGKGPLGLFQRLVKKIVKKF